MIQVSSSFVDIRPPLWLYNCIDYIEKKEEAYLDGEDISDDHLIQLVLNEYATRKIENPWGAPSAEQE